MNGLLLVDKPGGMTSHDVVARVRRATQEKSIGHLGTLDPMATGLLPLVLGKYTRLAQFFGSLEKHYTGTIRFGFATDTYDAEGAPTGLASAVSPTLEQVRALAVGFLGTTEQMPPPYSAKKIAGKPAYTLARAGIVPQLKPATVTIELFCIEGLAEEVATFSIQISSGGYVRSVAHELGARLGCGGHLASLRRTRAGAFSLGDALSLSEVEAIAAAGTLEDRLPQPRTLLTAMPCVTADTAALARLRNGMQVNLPEFSSAPLVKVFASQRELAAIAQRIAGTLFQPTVVLG